MKIIVSHISPDIDSITSIWLIKKFLPGWAKAELKFVNAGKTLDNKPPDENPNIIHVDTGLGQFDHHQTSEFTCAAKKVFEFLLKNKHIQTNEAKPLKKMIDEVNNFDHFGEVNFPQPDSYFYNFLITSIIDSSIKSILKDNKKIINYFLPLLDGIFDIFKKQVSSEKDIKNGLILNSYWGKTIILNTNNEESLKLALKKGFQLVIRKNPEKGYIRIKLHPNSKKTLKKLYEKIIQLDKKATWFYHVSGKMLLNSSSKNPDFIPSNLTLKQLIEIIKSI